MNLDSTVAIQVGYIAEVPLAEIVDTWDDGEIAELLEGDEGALADFAEEALEWVLNQYPVLQIVTVDGKPLGR